MPLNIYIDGNNLYRAAKDSGFKIDYLKFRGWLRQKYNPTGVYLFIGLVPTRATFYEYLQGCGFVLIFKQTISVGSTIKGNCDAELVLKVISDFYTRSFYTCILVTGDGDFGCLAEFLMKNDALNAVIAPSRARCSTLLRNKGCEIEFLDEHYHKFSIKIIKEKAPDADVSA